VTKKRSKIVKLRLPPHLLSRFTKKRKLVLGNGDEERAAKRQSTEPGSLLNGGGEKSGLVRVERGGADRPRLVLKMKVGRAGLP
jgi:transcription initiation factor TFIID subunit 2